MRAIHLFVTCYVMLTHNAAFVVYLFIYFIILLFIIYFIIILLFIIYFIIILLFIIFYYLYEIIMLYRKIVIVKIFLLCLQTWL